jgi:hypothetical protein
MPPGFKRVPFFIENDEPVCSSCDLQPFRQRDSLRPTMQPSHHYCLPGHN